MKITRTKRPDGFCKVCKGTGFDFDGSICSHCKGTGYCETCVSMYFPKLKKLDKSDITKYPSKPIENHKGWKKEKEFGEKIVKEIRFYTKDIVHNPNGGCFNSDYKKKKCCACKIDELCQRVELYYTDLIKPL